MMLVINSNNNNNNNNFNNNKSNNYNCDKKQKQKWKKKERKKERKKSSEDFHAHPLAKNFTFSVYILCIHRNLTIVRNGENILINCLFVFCLFQL